MEVEGIVYSLLLRINNVIPSNVPNGLKEYRDELSNAAKSKGQKYIWLQAGNSLEFWVAL